MIRSLQGLRRYFSSRLSLRNRVFINSAFISVVVLLVFSFANYQATSRLSLNNAVEGKQLVMDYFGDIVSLELKDTMGILYRIPSDESVRKALEGRNIIDTDDSLANERSSVNKAIDRVVFQPNFTGIRLFFGEEKPYTKESNRFFQMEEIKGMPWFLDVVAADGEVVWIGSLSDQVGSYKSLSTISAARALMSWEEPNKLLGVLVVDIDINLLFRLSLLNLRKQLGSEVFLIDQNGIVVCSLINTDIGQSIQAKKGFEGYASGEKYQENNGFILLTEEVFYPQGWRIALSFEKNTVTQVNRQIFNSFFILVVFSFFAVILTNFISASIFSRRLEEMVIALQYNIGTPADYLLAQNGELHKKIESFMVLSNRSQALLNTINEMELQRTEAQLSAMRAKINPHFLYNQLDIINWMAIRANAPEVADAIRRLSRYYRAHLSKGDDVISLRQELEHVNHYFDLLRIRTKDTVSYVIRCPEELKDCMVCNMLLQPLVENALEHGIMEKLPPCGRIEIKAYEENEMLVLEVIDDGVGIPPETLKMLNTDEFPQKDSGGYGYYNVKQRVRLYFGGASSVTAESDDRGTKIRLVLPIRM